MITSKDILKIVESDDIKSQILDLKKELKRLTGSDIDVGLSGNNKVYLAKHGNSTSPLDVDKLIQYLSKKKGTFSHYTSLIRYLNSDKMKKILQ